MGIFMEKAYYDKKHYENKNKIITLLYFRKKLFIFIPVAFLYI